MIKVGDMVIVKKVFNFMKLCGLNEGDKVKIIYYSEYSPIIKVENEKGISFLINEMSVEATEG